MSSIPSELQPPAAGISIPDGIWSPQRDASGRCVNWGSGARALIDLTGRAIEVEHLSASASQPEESPRYFAVCSKAVSSAFISRSVACPTSSEISIHAIAAVLSTMAPPSAGAPSTSSPLPGSSPPHADTPAESPLIAPLCVPCPSGLYQYCRRVRPHLDVQGSEIKDSQSRTLCRQHKGRGTLTTFSSVKAVPPANLLIARLKITAYDQHCSAPFSEPWSPTATKCTRTKEPTT